MVAPALVLSCRNEQHNSPNGRLCTPRPRGDAHSRCNGLHVYATYTCSRCTNDGIPIKRGFSGGVAAAQVANAASGEPHECVFRRN